MNHKKSWILWRLRVRKTFSRLVISGIVLSSKMNCKRCRQNIIESRPGKFACDGTYTEAA